jgi:dihydropteroate synthase
MSDVLHCGRFRLPLARPLVMGIVNVTPDSFYDGGAHFDAGRAAAHVHQLAEEGADILDIGGESTRPGAEPVSATAELARILPALEAAVKTGRPASVDTLKPEVMREALAAGAVMINDVRALEAPGALEAVAASDAAVCLMHMRGEPRTMQTNPTYADVVGEVRGYLQARVNAALSAGIARERIVVDPGIGFGKTVEHNLALTRRLDAFAGLGAAILVGWSRKSSLGRITGRDAAADRLPASLAAAVLAAQRGARILRVHDVAATRDALAVLNAVEGA